MVCVFVVVGEMGVLYVCFCVVVRRLLCVDDALVDGGTEACGEEGRRAGRKYLRDLLHFKASLSLNTRLC